MQVTDALWLAVVILDAVIQPTETLELTTLDRRLWN